MSNSIIFGGHLENMQIRSLRRHFSACQHWFLDLAYQSTPNQCVKSFFHKKQVHINFSDFSPWLTQSIQYRYAKWLFNFIFSAMAKKYLREYASWLTQLASEKNDQMLF